MTSKDELRGKVRDTLFDYANKNDGLNLGEATDAILNLLEGEKQKLLEIVEKAIEGNEVDVEATRERMQELGASDKEILNMKISADDTKDTLDGVRQSIKSLTATLNKEPNKGEEVDAEIH